MTEIADLLLSPAWWFGVVFVSVLINILSSYARSPLDRLISKVSRRWAERSDESKRKWHSTLDRLRTDNNLLTVFIAREHRHRQKEIFWIVVATAGLIGPLTSYLLPPLDESLHLAIHPRLVGLVAVSIALPFAFVNSLKATYYSNAIDEAFPSR